MKKCMGNCEGKGNPCIGEIKRVHVFDKDQDWGDYWYCEKAIQRDKDMGFTIEEIGETK